MKKFIEKLKKYLSIKNITLVSFMMLPILASAADIFAPAKGEVKDTFGSGSTVQYILYILEALAAVFAYIRTKNLAVFGGIVAVMLFFNVIFGIIG